MIDVDIDHLGEVDLEKLARDITKFPATVERVVKAAVEEERRSHAYVNRSGATEQGTAAVVESDGPDLLVVEAYMREPHSGYLQGKWSHFERNMRRAATKLADEQNKMGG